MATEEEIDDDELLQLLRMRMASPPARFAVDAAKAMSASEAAGGGDVLRRDMSRGFNQELREAYKEGPRARGERFFDQGEGTQDFERLKKFNEEAPRRVKKIDPNEPTHESRRLHREMRARTKGGQMMDEQQLRDYIRLVEEGYKQGGGKPSGRTVAKKAAKMALARGIPGVGALFTGLKIGGALSSAAGRERGRDERRELYESRQKRIEAVFPGRSADFYLGMAQQMGKEDAAGHEVRDAEEVLRLFELQQEIDAIKDGPARELVREVSEDQEAFESFREKSGRWPYDR